MTSQPGAARVRVNPTTGEIVDNPLLRPFADWLQEQARGQAHQELTEALWDLVQAVQATGKPGTITLTVTVEPMRKTGGQVIVTRHKVKTAPPEPDREPSVSWVDRNGNLTRDNPNQPDLFELRETPAPNKETDNA
jgi:hypothetical protein